MAATTPGLALLAAEAGAVAAAPMLAAILPPQAGCPGPCCCAAAAACHICCCAWPRAAACDAVVEDKGVSQEAAELPPLAPEPEAATEAALRLAASKAARSDAAFCWMRSSMACKR